MGKILDVGTRWYLAIYYDSNGNSVEAVTYDENEIRQYISREEFDRLERDMMVGIRAPEDWLETYGVDNYTIREI
jgi:hypothetical protein